MSDTADLERESYISLVTYRRDGTEVATPVWHVILEGRVYVFTEAASYKVKRLRRDSRARVAACGAFGRVHGRWLDANGRVVDDSGLTNRVYAGLAAKYGWQMRLVDILSAAAGRIGGRAILEITA